MLALQRGSRLLSQLQLAARAGAIAVLPHNAVQTRESGASASANTNFFIREVCECMTQTSFLGTSRGTQLGDYHSAITFPTTRSHESDMLLQILGAVIVAGIYFVPCAHA